MKRISALALALILAFTCAFAFSGCSKKDSEKSELVLITDGAPVNDKAYNQYTWNGLKAYSEENSVSCRYYQPSLNEEGELTTEEIAKYVDLAVKGGAKQIVLPGEKFAVAAYEIAPTYKDVQFVLIDAVPHSRDDDTMRLQSNVECIKFNKLQAGFLAGYCSVINGSYDIKNNKIRDYNTKLGFLGSVASQDATDYGAGYLQGAEYAADEKSVPVYLDYAEYDSLFLNYDYSFTIKPVYVKREEAKKDTFKVNVVDGIGSGVYTDGENVTITANPAPEGKVFDHWEAKSDTKGVKDKKVNISSKKDPSMNLLIGDCDCTITAVWADAKTVPVTVTAADGATAAQVLNVPENSNAWIEAPAAENGMVFDHWESSMEDIVEDVQSKGTNVKVGNQAVAVTPVYRESEVPTFNLMVENGTGTGSYVTGDIIKVVADAPEEGYMFYKWENVDNQGLSTGIAMDNEYCYHAEFEMVDRYASIVEKMYDEGCQVVFAGGNSVSDSIFVAADSFDYNVYTFGSGIDEGSKSKCIASVVTDYGNAIKLALKDYKGGSIFTGDCSNDCIYVTGKSVNEFELESDGTPKTDKKGNKIEDKNYSADYASTIKKLNDGSIKLINVQKGADLKSVVNSKCLTFNYWVVE